MRFRVTVVLATVGAVALTTPASGSLQTGSPTTVPTTGAGLTSGVPEPGYVAAPPPTSPGHGAGRVTAAYPYAQTFTLHSRPGATRTIYLDFNGTTVSPGSWSTLLTGISPTTYPGFNLQGSATTFSEAEQAFIQQVWRRVAESYAPFEVDVTTQDPGPAAISRTSPSDTAYGIQVAITSDPNAPSAACGSGSRCSGIAPLNTFDAVEDSPGEHQPAWVFATNTYPDLAYPNSASLTAASVTHEVGHTFGLTHDATAAQPGYYAGHGSWFPLMGQTLGRTSIGQWSKGEYAGANNLQDDLAVIAAKVPRRADDAATAPAAPTDLGTRTSYAVNGVIGSDADNDYFTFHRRCSGPMRVKATGIGYGAAVDLRLSVLDSTGALVATNNPAASQTRVAPDPYYRATGLDASVAISRAANAPYRVKVEGVGFGNPLDTGYSGYGSIGQYRLTVTSCSTPLSITRPGAPVIGAARSGQAGSPVNARARWSAPRSNGGAALTGYRLQAAKVNSRGAVVRTYTFSSVSPTLTARTVALPPGRYKFRIAATNRIGTGRYSAYSALVVAR